MKLLLEEYEGIRRWMYRNARPLDLARWRFHFEGGGAAQVLEALTAYQNEDGGFGYALEADSWNPHSTPIQTATAVERLLELEFSDAEHPLVQGILNYLDSGADMDERTWRNVVASNNDYPHAPWWHTEAESTSRSIYNPTAILAGFILKYAQRDSRLYGAGLAIARELTELFLNDPNLEMHPLKCVATLLECIAWADLQEEFPYAALRETLKLQSVQLISRDAGEWNGYSCRPSAFIHSPHSPEYAELGGLLHQELDYLLGTRNSEGVWNLTWSWAGYEREFAVSENWWKAHIIIENLRLLRAFGRMAELPGTE